MKSITDLSLSDKIYHIMDKKQKFDGIMSSDHYPFIEENKITAICKAEEKDVFILNCNGFYDTYDSYEKDFILHYDDRKKTSN